MKFDRAFEYMQFVPIIPMFLVVLYVVSRGRKIRTNVLAYQVPLCAMWLIDACLFVADKSYYYFNTFGFYFLLVCDANQFYFSSYSCFCLLFLISCLIMPLFRYVFVENMLFNINNLCFLTFIQYNCCIFAHE